MKATIEPADPRDPHGAYRAALDALEGRAGPSANGLRPGERALRRFLWVSLVEPRSAGGSWQGRSRGVSVPLGSTGVRVRLGANKGHYVKAPEVPTPIDTGTLLVTNVRALFQGSRRTQEWAFAKLLDPQHDPKHRLLLLPVTNRQKVSGLQYAKGEGDALIDMLAVARGIGLIGAEQALAELRQILGVVPPNPALDGSPRSPTPARPRGSVAPTGLPPAPALRPAPPAKPTGPPPPGGPDPSVALLEDLERLHNAGVLSDAEWHQKAALLGVPAPQADAGEEPPAGQQPIDTSDAPGPGDSPASPSEVDDESSGEAKADQRRVEALDTGLSDDSGADPHARAAGEDDPDPGAEVLGEPDDQTGWDRLRSAAATAIRQVHAHHPAEPGRPPAPQGSLPSEPAAATGPDTGAGWFPDPAQRWALRWFDGTGWTAHVAGDDRTTGLDPL